MKEFLLLEKQVGETPLQCLERFRAAHSEYLGTKMTYAGRLDPMASGLMVVLAGNMVHQKDDYLKLLKVYECTILLGVATDTYDTLGIPVVVRHPGEGRDPGLESPGFKMNDSGSRISSRPSLSGMTDVLGSFLGTFRQEYPPYSSKTIGGKQLHELARSGDLADKDIPSQMVTVSNIWDIEITPISFGETVTNIVANIRRVQGDFRQAYTIASWQTLAQAHPSAVLQTISFKISVSGGTYIRSIAHELGQKLGTGACVLSLHRTQIGQYTLENKDF